MGDTKVLSFRVELELNDVALSKDSVKRDAEDLGGGLDNLGLVQV